MGVLAALVGYGRRRAGSALPLPLPLPLAAALALRVSVLAVRDLATSGASDEEDDDEGDAGRCAGRAGGESPAAVRSMTGVLAIVRAFVCAVSSRHSIADVLLAVSIVVYKREAPGDLQLVSASNTRKVSQSHFTGQAAS